MRIEDLNEACADCDADRTTASALDNVFAHLPSKGVLTKWQCDKLRTGRWKGYFLDGYCFLCQLSKDMTTSTYLCKEMATGKRVAMAVTPPALDPVKDGKIHYTVREITEESQADDDV